MVSYAVLDTTRHQCKFEIRMIVQPPHANMPLVQEYLEDVDRVERGKIVAELILMARRGPHPNREKFGDLGDGVYELKINQHRIPFFYSGAGVIVLTHGFFKRQRKAPPMQVRRAKKLRELYLARFG